VIDPFGTGNLERLRERVSEAASRSARNSPGAATSAAPVPSSITVPSSKPVPSSNIVPPSNAASPTGPVLNVPSAVRENVLVVGDAPSGAHSYASLHASCNDAKNGDVIELRFDGRRQERPIVISHIKLAP